VPTPADVEEAVRRAFQKMLLQRPEKLTATSLKRQLSTELIDASIAADLVDMVEPALRAAEEAEAKAKKAAEEAEAKARVWDAALSSAGVQNVVWPLRQVLLDTPEGRGLLPDLQQREALQRVFGWKLALGKVLTGGEAAVRAWFAARTAELQERGAKDLSMTADGLLPVFEEGRVVALVSHFLPPLPHSGRGAKDTAMPLGLSLNACTAGGSLLAPRPETPSSQLLKLPVVRPRLSGEMATVDATEVDCQSIVWSPERVELMARCSTALATHAPGHLLSGVHGCGKSTTLAALVSVASVGAGADVLYVPNGEKLAVQPIPTLLQGLSTCSGEALTLHTLEVFLLPLVKHKGAATGDLLAGALEQVFGSGAGGGRTPRMVVVDEVNNFSNAVGKLPESEASRYLARWCVWDGLFCDIGTMRVLASSPDTNLLDTIKPTSFQVFHEMRPMRSELLAAVMLSGVDAGLALPPPEQEGAGGTSQAVTRRPSIGQVQHMTTALGSVTRYVLRYLLFLSAQGHDEALRLAMGELSGELRKRLVQQWAQQGTTVGDVPWKALAAAARPGSLHTVLVGLVNASMVVRRRPYSQEITGNLESASLAARQALLSVLCSGEGGDSAQQRVGRALLAMDSEDLEQDVAALLTMGLCGHRSLCVGAIGDGPQAASDADTVLQRVLKDAYPQGSDASALLQAVSPMASPAEVRPRTLLLSVGQEGGHTAHSADPYILQEKAVPTEVLLAVQNMRDGDAIVLRTPHTFPALDVVLVHMRAGVRHVVLVEVTKSSLNKHATRKQDVPGLPASLRDIGCVVLPRGWGVQETESGDVKLTQRKATDGAGKSGEVKGSVTVGAGKSDEVKGGVTTGAGKSDKVQGSMNEVTVPEHGGSQGELPETGKGAAQLTGAGQAGGEQEEGAAPKADLSLANAWLTALGADVRVHATLVPGAVPKLYVSSAATAPTLPGKKTTPQWCVHLLYVTSTSVKDNETYLNACNLHLQSPLVHCMMGDDRLPLKQLGGEVSADGS